MILKTVYIRFYRAFNHHYLRALDSRVDHHHHWDKMGDGTPYPYVALDINQDLTAVVGANESGKSQLLKAIEFALGTKKPSPTDFCRYSVHFTVAEEMRIPDFGAHFTQVDSPAIDAIARHTQPDGDENQSVSSFRIFRTHPNKVVAYWGEDETPHEIADDHIKKLNKELPNTFRIIPDLAVPDSVPISFLAQNRNKVGVPALQRAKRLGFFDQIISLIEPTQEDEERAKIRTEINQYINDLVKAGGQAEEGHQDQLDLAFDLLVTVSKIEPAAFKELHKALRKGNEGMAIGIAHLMNLQIEKHLNLAKWWSQDKKFQLAIEVRDFDIVFTVRDRTGSQYSFGERSEGLKYFLSYLVQCLAQVRRSDDAEVFLMDEPDAYLSNQGQQDLLRLLQKIATPEKPAQRQVVYVTHSPFLIDRNRPDGIRVLDKGAHAEGTLVVDKVLHNHFEPVRTAIGGVAGETLSIDKCNLVVEGSSDHLYLSRMSVLLQREGKVDSTQVLDLNRVNLMESGGAQEVPYRALHALGRNVHKPAVIVLLDGDKAGDEAKRKLLRFGPAKSCLLKPEYIVQLGYGEEERHGLSSDRSKGPQDIEDLIPVKIGLEAARRYLIGTDRQVPESFPKAPRVMELVKAGMGVFGAIQAGLAEANIDLELSKTDFARHVVASCEADEGEPGQAMRDRFAALFAHLTEKQREAEREREQESLEYHLGLEIRRFKRDHLDASPNRVDVKVLLDRMKSVVDDRTEEGAIYLDNIQRIRKRFELYVDLDEPIQDKDDLYRELEALKYAAPLGASDEDTAPLAPDPQGESPPGIPNGFPTLNT